MFLVVLVSNVSLYVMTWSSLPTESQGLTRTKSDLTGNSAKNAVQRDEGLIVPRSFPIDIHGDAAQLQDNESNVFELEADPESIMYTSDLGNVLKAGQSTITLIEACTIQLSVFLILTVTTEVW